MPRSFLLCFAPTCDPVFVTVSNSGSCTESKEAAAGTKEAGVTMSEEAEELPAQVQVTWSGKKIWIERAKLDEWYNQSYEARVYHVKSHPYIVQRVPIHKFKKDDVPDLAEAEETTTWKREEAGEEDAKKKEAEAKKAQEDSEEPPDMSKLVLVHWGGKSLLLEREQLDEWYSESYEDHLDFIERNPSRVYDQ